MGQFSTGSDPPRYIRVAGQFQDRQTCPSCWVKHGLLGAELWVGVELKNAFCSISLLDSVLFQLYRVINVFRGFLPEVIITNGLDVIDELHHAISVFFPLLSCWGCVAYLKSHCKNFRCPGSSVQRRAMGGALWRDLPKAQEAGAADGPIRPIPP